MLAANRPLRIGSRILFLAGVGLAAMWLWPSVQTVQSDLTRLNNLLEHGQAWRERNHNLAILIYLGGFTVAAALPVPAIIALTLAGGAFFGFWLGLVLSLMGALGAAIMTFMAARHVLAGSVRRLLGRRVRQLDRMVRNDGALALLSLRLTPGMPFFVLNLICGVSRLSARIFALVTAIGMLPNQVIVTAAGTQLAGIDSIADIIGPRMIAIALALALFPWVARWMTRRWRRRVA